MAIKGAMTVHELMARLAEVNPDLPVVRGDADWGFVSVPGVYIAQVKDEGESRGWEVYDADEEPWEDEVRVRVLKIS